MGCDSLPVRFGKLLLDTSGNAAGVLPSAGLSGGPLELAILRPVQELGTGAAFPLRIVDFRTGFLVAGEDVNDSHWSRVFLRSPCVSQFIALPQISHVTLSVK